MRSQWDENTPTVTHVDPDNRQLYAEVALSHGKDDVWSWWHPDPTGSTMVHLTVPAVRTRCQGRRVPNLCMPCSAEPTTGLRR